MISPPEPTLATVLNALAAIIGMFILREFVVLRDWRIKNNDIPRSVAEHGRKLEAMASQLEVFLLRLDRHCTEEETQARQMAVAFEQWKQERREEARRAMALTHEAVNEAELRLTKSINALAQKVDETGERRKRTR